jgi:hypothetical protein
MSNVEGRDLATIVQHGDEIRAVDTFNVDGNPQTMFGWQAYWTGDWYPAWRDDVLLGSGKTISAKDAIHQFLPTLAFPVEAEFDNYLNDTNDQYAAKIDQATEQIAQDSHCRRLWCQAAGMIQTISRTLNNGGCNEKTLVSWPDGRLGGADTFDNRMRRK